MGKAEELRAAADEIIEEIDDLVSTHVINANNDVEGGWRIRGFIECLTGRIDKDSMTDENYGSDYREGVAAGQVARTMR